MAENIPDEGPPPNDLSEIVKKNPDNQPEHAYGFPFKPYDIQIELMDAAYEVFEKEKFSILESPTGTGKSLSLICSALSWLRDYNLATKHKLEATKDELNSRIDKLKREEELSRDWLSIQTKRKEVDRQLEDVNKKLEHILKFERRNEARRHAKLHNIPLEHYASLVPNENLLNQTLDISMNETRDENSLITNSGSVNQSTLADVTFNEDQDDLEKSIKLKPDEDSVRPKIFYASRTHSQLSQFINELKRTKFANVDIGPTTKVTALASRANLCVNPEVLKLRDSSAINERCMEMQKDTKPENKCPYVKAKHLEAFKDDILSSVYDIEDLVMRGKSHGSCPYYSARLAIPEAELVVLPYNNLLHRETRQASSLDLKDNIVIVDEAHNILETICSIHSAPINGLQLVGSHTILSRYYQKYRSRMNPKNAQMVKTIVQCLTALLRYLREPSKHIRDYDNPKAVDLDHEKSKEVGGQRIDSTIKTSQPSMKNEEFMVDVQKFTGASSIERFNVYKIIDFFNRSQLARKLLGLYKQDNSLDLDMELYDLEKTGDTLSKDGEQTSSPKKKRRRTLESKKSGKQLNNVTIKETAQQWELTSLSFLKPFINLKNSKHQNLTMGSYPIYTLIEFFRSLTNSSDDGKILTDLKPNDILNSSLKFILLNPASQFKQITQEARALVLAGGTMQPFNEFTNLLFGPLGVDESRLKLFSCGHVITDERLHVAILTNGPTGKPLELSYKVKNSIEYIDEIGRALVNIANIVPGGMVCFLPSYEYEQSCFNRWSQTGIIARIETQSKQVFREPRQASHLKSVLEEYSLTIEKNRNKSRGALLFCVVGGKMSEGINFNDDLGRCVVMIGLPYANIRSGELQQKMSYYDLTCPRVTKESSSPGQQYYENLCIKGINQSIGRAIRHKNDYAAIILLDRRYATKINIKKGLPAWMSKSLTEYERFGLMFSQLKSFYKNIKSL